MTQKTVKVYAGDLGYLLADRDTGEVLVLHMKNTSMFLNLPKTVDLSHLSPKAAEGDLKTWTDWYGKTHTFSE